MPRGENNKQKSNRHWVSKSRLTWGQCTCVDWPTERRTSRPCFQSHLRHSYTTHTWTNMAWTVLSVIM